MSAYKIPNGTLDRWASGVPVQMDATTTNTTLTQLLASFAHDRDERTTFPNDEFLIDRSALRATLTSSASAGDFNLRVEGSSADGSGSTGLAIPVTPGRRYAFSFYARGTDGNELGLLLALRDSSDNVILYADPSADPVKTPFIRLAGWSTGEDTVNFQLKPRWHLFAASLLIPFEDASNALPATLTWGLENRTAGAQTIDIYGLDFIGQTEEIA